MAIKFEAEKRVAGKYNEEDMQPHDTIAAIFSKGTGDACKYATLDHVKCNMLTMPIGKVKKDQAITEALAEECKEEVGVSIQNYQEVLQFNKVYERDGKKIPVKTHVFKITKYLGTLKNLETKKHRWLKWMTRKELESSKRDLSDAYKYYFAWLDDQNTPSLVKPHVKVGG